MWSVRMRASKFENDSEKHISGAEGIYDLVNIERALKEFFKRALTHSKGQPDKIVFTVEKIYEPIKKIEVLPVKTIFCKSPEEAFNKVRENLLMLGISEKSISKAFEVIRNCKMRGASLIDINTTERLEKDKQRGVRVSRIQMDKKTRNRILRKIRRLSSNPQRVIEAITIASKVAYLNEIIAEICISDNPDYTTGYIASRNFGYLRITNIKNQGDERGGRVFFVKSPVDIEKVVSFLEKTPVLVI